MPNTSLTGKMTTARIEQHRAHMLHDVLPSSPLYRVTLAECCAMYDALRENENSRRMKDGRPKGRGPQIVVGRRLHPPRSKHRGMAT